MLSSFRCSSHRALSKKWYCTNTNANQKPEDTAAWKRYQASISKQAKENAKQEVTIEYGQELNFQEMRDYEKAKGTVLNSMIQDGAMGILPDEEHTAIAGGTHPAMPKIMPAPKGKFVSELASEMMDGLSEDAEKALGSAKSLTQAKAQADLQKRKEFVKTRDTNISNAQSAIASGTMSATEAASTFIKPIQGQMVPDSAFPPLPEVAPPHRVLTDEQRNIIHEAAEQTDKAMERVYDAAYKKWLEQKEMRQRVNSDGTLDLKLDVQDDEETAKRRAEAIAALKEKEATTLDPLEELERKYFPGKSAEQEKEDREKFEKKKAEAQVNLKSLKNALTTILQKQIVMTGPKPLGDFMKELMVNPEYGYYTTKKKVFGREGDFITSPEISMMFSECLLAWAHDTWCKLGCPAKFYLVELGGGRGSLMAMLLRVAADSFPDFFAAMIPCMVEVSPTLRQAQRDKILELCNKEILDRVVHSDDFEGLPLRTKPFPVISLCNELFDVFAVSKFQYTEKGWCEWMVEYDEDPTVPEHFKFVLSPGETGNSILSIPHDIRQKCREERLLGKTIELQMQGYNFLDRILAQVSRLGGAFLVIDYGVDDYVEDSLRGIKDHKFVHPLSSPGEVDLSGFVSFLMLRKTVTRNANLSNKIHVSSVMTQAEFLKRTGIEARTTYHLLQTKNPRDASKISREMSKLIDEGENGMGQKFKVMCFSTTSRPGLIPPCPWYKDDLAKISGA